MFEIRERLRRAWAKAARRDLPGDDGSLVVSTFSYIYCGVYLLLAAVGIYVLRWTLEPVPALAFAWIELFEIREIFGFDFITQAAVADVYRLIVNVAVLLVVAKLLLSLLRLTFSRLVLREDRIIVVEQVFFYSRLHHVPYDRIDRLSLIETIAHRVVDLGSITVITADGAVPLRIGPIRHFSSIVSRITSAMRRA